MTLPASLILSQNPCQCGSRFVRRSMMQHVAMTLQRINRRNVGKTNQLGKEAGSATVSATGSQRLPDKKPRQGVIISVKGSYLLRMSLCSAFPYVPNTARNGHLLVSNPFISGILQVYFSVNFFIACLCGPAAGRYGGNHGEECSSNQTQQP